jgi:hypothetical protein
VECSILSGVWWVELRLTEHEQRLIDDRVRKILSRPPGNNSEFVE